MASGRSSTSGGLPGRMEGLQLEDSREAACPPCTAPLNAYTESLSTTSSTLAEGSKFFEPIWPVTSRNPSILQPLSFPEAPKRDLSLFTDPTKDFPIYCLICDSTFSPRGSEDESREATGLEREPSRSISETTSSHTKLRNHSEQRISPIGSATTTKFGESGHGYERKVGADSEREIFLEREESVREKFHLSPKDEWLRHLLVEHHIVVHQVSDVCSLKGYGLHSHVLVGYVYRLLLHISGIQSIGRHG